MIKHACNVYEQSHVHSRTLIPWVGAHVAVQLIIRVHAKYRKLAPFD